MRVLSPALTSILFLAAADAFSPISSGRASTLLHGGGGMDAYDAQMAAIAQNQQLASGSGATATATPPVGYANGSSGSYLDTLSRTDAIAAEMLDSSRKASTAATAPAKTDNFKSSPRWRKKTKQLATLGPASSSFEMIEKLFLAGGMYGCFMFYASNLSFFLSNIDFK